MDSLKLPVCVGGVFRWLSIARNREKRLAGQVMPCSTGRQGKAAPLMKARQNLDHSAFAHTSAF